MRLIKDICYSNYSECLLDIYLPESEKFCVFVYFHGGGLEGGTHDFDLVYGGKVI